MGITGKKREREIQRQTEEMLPTLFICGSHVLNAEKDCNEKQKITNTNINIFAKLEICRKINLFLLLLVLLVYTVATAVNETNLYFFFVHPSSLLSDCAFFNQPPGRMCFCLLYSWNNICIYVSGHSPVVLIVGKNSTGALQTEVSRVVEVSTDLPKIQPNFTLE